MDGDNLLHKLLVLYENNELKWTTRQREQILIGYMSDLHLKNAVNYLENANRTAYSEVLKFILKLELMKRCNKNKD